MIDSSVGSHLQSNVPAEPSLFAEFNHPFAILTEKEILGMVNSGRLIIDGTFDESSLQATTYDVRAGRFGIVGGHGKAIDMDEESIVIEPGSYAGVISFEKVKLPNRVMAIIGAKRKFAYEGVILLTGSVIDPGYEGHLLFGLYNASTKKVVIPSRTKVCTIHFIELDAEQKPVAPCPSLLHGNLPPDFINKMANMEVLPWARISEEVKQIQRLTQDVLDLKAKYTDVLEPIKTLTSNVDKVNSEVGLLAREMKDMAQRMERVGDLTGENARQVSDISASVKLLTTQVVEVKERGSSSESRVQQLETKLGSYSIIAKVIWAIIFLVISAGIGALLKTYLFP